MTDNIPMIQTWMGRPVEDLTREELLEVLQWLAGQYHDLMSPENCRARAIGMVEMMKNGSLH